MAPFNHFDLLAPYYDRFIKPTDPTEFCALAGLPAQGLLLDLAGGTGLKSYPLLHEVGGIVIADSSMGMLAQASMKVGLVNICSVAEQLPFDNETFDRVIMVDALHHVNDYRITIDEMWRVTKVWGRIVIEEPNIRTNSVKLMAVIEKLALMRSHFVPPEAIAARFGYPHSDVHIKYVDSTAWIIVDKQGA